MGSPAANEFMLLALAEAQAALLRQEVPIGCVIVLDGTVIAKGSNRTNETRNSWMLLSSSGPLGPDGAARSGPELYVTCEPCIMCAGALCLLGLGKVVYGCGNDRFGGCGSILDIHQQGCGSCQGQSEVGGAASSKPHRFQAEGGMMAADAIALLQDFYASGNPNAPVPKRPLAAP
ncbi:hypothetical protein WJX84_000292 [Apatococcus fuscideae]|uniref:CMP/dCMP-type deaminase domain-containing protein n=1 Tax=Apatococcus fuscideae TaxID=2026836 RepID=A0AAW1T2W3_9CHLO